MSVIISVDLNSPRGPVHPLHGMGNGPVTRRGTHNHIDDFREAGVPYCRLHDTEYPLGSGVYVDIHCIFPNFDADENDPASYYFAHTDRYLSYIEQSGAKTFYRLGESIDHAPVKSHIFPPKDNKKWAVICEHIIAHYTEGWADGYTWDIPYWEIWNEPDNFEDIVDNDMWQGTPEQYFELYVTAANHLKSRFPHLKIGGYGSCGFYAVTGTDASAAAKSTPRFNYFVEFAHAFFKYITDPAHPAPLDFFSWHSYANRVEDNIKFALYARNLLDSYGFTACESILNEWNPRPVNPATFNKPEDAAAIMANFAALHDIGLDVATYYVGDPGSGYCKLFDTAGNTAKAWQAFRAFGEAYRLGTYLPSTQSAPVWTLAATDGEKTLLILTNASKEPQTCTLDIPGLQLSALRAVDEEHDCTALAELPSGNSLTLAPWQILLCALISK